MTTRQITFEHTGTLVVHECPSCFVLHAIPQDMHDLRQAEGGSVYCPNGHAWIFTEPETARLKRQLREAEQVRDEARRQRDLALASKVHEADQRRAAERSAAAYKGQATRLRNRAAAGACPAGCHRTFANLARHMASQHPDFAEPDVAEGS